MQSVSGVYQRRYVNGSELELDVVSDKTVDDIAGILADMDYEITDMSKSVVDVSLKMTIETISYDIQANTASVRGVGKILQDNSTGLMLARRTAITDAQIRRRYT